MNKLVKRGIAAYRIFLKNKLAMAVMMLVSGVMMFVAAMNGKGNDTMMMPLGITLAGLVFTLWAFYQIGKVRANLGRAETEDDKKVGRATLTLQILECAIYLMITAVGVFLLINQSFTNRVLNLMAGGFTTLNGVIGVTYLFRHRQNRGWWFYFKTLLTIVELVLGIYFIMVPDNTEIGWYKAMGILTMVAGTIEVLSALTPGSLKNTVQDGKDIVRILKDEKSEQDKQD